MKVVFHAASSEIKAESEYKRVILSPDKLSARGKKTLEIIEKCLQFAKYKIVIVDDPDGSVEQDIWHFEIHLTSGYIENYFFEQMAKNRFKVFMYVVDGKPVLKIERF